MDNKKQYIIDTNVLLEDPNALFKLRNGNENAVYIPYHVLLELDKFKKNSKLAHIVARVIQYLLENPEQYQISKMQLLSSTKCRICPERNAGHCFPDWVKGSNAFVWEIFIRLISRSLYFHLAPGVMECWNIGIFILYFSAIGVEKKFFIINFSVRHTIPTSLRFKKNFQTILSPLKF